MADPLKPVIPEVGLVGVVIIAVPATKLHEPVPVVAVFPASVAVARLDQLPCGLRAAAFQLHTACFQE